MARKPNDVAGIFEKNPGSGVWYIRYRAGGRSVRKMIGTRAAAEAELTKVKLIKKGVLHGVIAKSAKEGTRTTDELENGVTVGQLCDEYLDHIQSESNPNRPSDQFSPPQRIAAIKEAFGDRAAVSVLPHEIRAWLHGLGKKPATLNRYRSVLSSVYRYAKEQSKITVNPVRDLKQFKVLLPNPRWLRPGEEGKLRAVLNKWIADCPDHHRLTKLFLRCHPIELTVALGTGLRKGNQYALRWDTHVDFDKREFHLPPSMTKTGKALNIPMIDDVYDALRELQDIQRQISELRAEVQDKDPKRMVSDGRVFNIAENREWWKALLKEATVENLRWHDLRHTFASRLVEAGVNMKIVQEACGHASMAMTARYAHVNNHQLHDALSNLNRSVRSEPAA
jgi:integrase